MTNSEEIKLALLVQRVEQLSRDIAGMKTDLEGEIQKMKLDLDGLKSNALRLSGGFAVIVIVATVMGWAINFFANLKFPKI